MDALLAAAAEDSGDEEFDDVQTKEEYVAEDISVEDESAELAVDDKSLVCRITEFFPRTEKMCYRIKGETSLAEFKNRQFEVVRKYEDFLWLHERLTENKSLAGVLIPHLPEKVTWISPEPSQIAQKVTYGNGPNIKLTDQFQKRAHQLNRFLKRICRHKLLREDIHVVVFLEFAEDIKPINNKSWFGIPTWYWDYVGANRDAKAKEIRNWVENYRTKVNIVKPKAEDKLNNSRVIASIESELIENFREDWEDQSTPLMRVFRHFSNGLVRSHINHHIRAQIEETLIEVLDDYVGTADATSAMLDRSAALFGLSAQVEKQLQRAEKDVDAHEVAGTSGTSRGEAAKQKLARLKNDSEVMRSDCATAESVIEKELKLAGKRRTADFKDVFVSLCENEIHQAQNRIATWKEFLTEIKRVQFPPLVSTEHDNDDNDDKGTNGTNNT